METIMVGLAVGLAIFFIGRSYYRKFIGISSGNGCGCGCSGCPSAGNPRDRDPGSNNGCAGGPPSAPSGSMVQETGNQPSDGESSHVTNRSPPLPAGRKRGMPMRTGRLP